MAPSVAVSEDSCSNAGRSLVFLANSSENALKPTDVNSGLKFTSVPGGFALCDEPQALTANAAHSVSSANLLFIALPVRAHRPDHSARASPLVSGRIGVRLYGSDPTFAKTPIGIRPFGA